MHQILAIALVFVVNVFAWVFPVAAEEIQWDYQGDLGPSKWGELSDKFLSCSAGEHQSPINIDSLTNSSQSSPSIHFDYQSAIPTIANNGHSIQLDYSSGSTMTIAGNAYDLLQFHFHTPSEHQVEGQKFPMELHLVHRNEQGDLAVVALLIKSGSENTAIKKIWRQLPASGVTIRSNREINTAALLPPDGDNQNYFNYTGSLTTPPCTEGVEWYIMTEPITFSAEQIEAFQAIYPANARPLQGHA